MSELYSGTESAVRCGGTISDLFPVFPGVYQGCILAFPDFSVLVWTGCERGCRRDQAAVHRLGMSRSLTLISHVMQFRHLCVDFRNPFGGALVSE